MRILLINRGYIGGGGAEAAVRGLAQLSRGAGHQVTVLSLSANPHAREMLRPFRQDAVKNWWGIECRDENGIQACSFNTASNYIARRGNHLISRFFVFLFDWLNVVGPIKALLLIKKLKSDVVHTHNLRGMGMLMPVAVRLARCFNPPRSDPSGHSRLAFAPEKRASRERIRWIHTAHDIQLAYPSGIALYPALELKLDAASTICDRKSLKPFEIALEVIRTIYEGLERLIWGSPDIVISPSNFLKEFYRERGFFKKSRWEVTPNVLNQGDLLSYPLLNKERTGVASILFVGALEHSKGIEILLDAWKHIQRKEIKLVIVGEGSLRTKLEYEYLPNVVFYKVLPPEKIIELFSQALVTVVPSLTYENAPMVILESLRVGVPVLASRIGGIPEYIEEGVTGWLVEPGSADQLCLRLQLVVRQGVNEDIKRSCVREAVEVGVRAHAAHLELCRVS